MDRVLLKENFASQRKDLSFGSDHFGEFCVAMANHSYERRVRKEDLFLLNYNATDLKIASEFLSNWLPFLSRGLCRHCTRTLSDRVRSLVSGSVKSPMVRMSWADMAQEDELEAEDESNGNGSEENSAAGGDTFLKEIKPKSQLSKEQRELIRFNNVQRKNDFICLEHVNRKIVNILDGLELHAGVFSAAEQKRIVQYVEELREKGQNGQLKLFSVLVLNGNGADVAKHCVPAVPTKRISITFRRMDESKRPNGYVQEPDLEGLQPLSFDTADNLKESNSPKPSVRFTRKQPFKREVREESTTAKLSGGYRSRSSEPRQFSRI